MSQTLTKKDLDGALVRVEATISDRFTSAEHRLGGLNERFDGVERRLTDIKEDLAMVKDDVAKVKLAVLDYLATDRAVRNLVVQLKAQGIVLDESKIFAV